MPSLSVSGKAAVITGAGSGINYELAKLLLSKGCNVLIADIALRPESQALLDQYKSGTPRAIYHKTDVTVWSELEAALNAGITTFGAIDIVVPGAGVFEPPWSTFWNPPSLPPSIDTRTSNAYAQLSINLTHPIRLTQVAISHFLNRSIPANESTTPGNPGPYIPGTIIHISSIAAQSPSLHTAVYGASKAAISHFVRSLTTLEPERNIRVAAVAPGLVKTPLFTETEKIDLVDEEKDVWATPGEVAQAMLDLIEMEGNDVGGKVLEVGAGNRRWVAALGDPGPGGGTVSRYYADRKTSGSGEGEIKKGTEGMTASAMAGSGHRAENWRKVAKGWGQE